MRREVVGRYGQLGVLQASVGSTIAPGPASPAAAFTPVLRVAPMQNVPTWIGRA